MIPFKPILLRCSSVHCIAHHLRVYLTAARGWAGLEKPMNVFPQTGMHGCTATSRMMVLTCTRLNKQSQIWARRTSQHDCGQRKPVSPDNFQLHTRPVACEATSEGQNCNASNTSPFAALWSMVDSQFLPIALALSLTAGYTLPDLAVLADAANTSKISTFVIFVISGLNMRRGEAMQALHSQKAFIFGLLSILFITPLAGTFVMQLGMQPVELMVGLAIFICMPTSLSANIALSGAVGANTAMSILLTISSNVVSIFTVPLMLATVLTTSEAIKFDVTALIQSLIRTVLMPLLLGASLRVLSQVRQLMDQNRKLVRNLSTLCLATVPFTQIGVARANGYTQGLTLPIALKLVGVIIATLLCIRAFNIAAVHILKLGRRQKDPRSIKRAVVLAASQKTLPIAVAVIIQLGDTIGQRAGLAVLPCVLAHFSQVVVDSMLVSWWKDRDLEQGPV